MNTNMKVMLSALGAAALLVSPALAYTVPQRNVAPSAGYIPYDARASVAPYGTFEGGPYTPSLPAPTHGVSPDFQNGHPQ